MLKVGELLTKWLARYVGEITVGVRVTAKALTPIEEAHLATIKLWLDSMRDWLAFVSRDDELIVVDSKAPLWVEVCAKRIDTTLLAPVTAVLGGDSTLTPYRLGYALGLMKWGNSRINSKVPPELKAAVRGIRLAKKARRKLVRMCEDFFISVQILVRRNGKLKDYAHRELSHAKRLSRKYTGRDESDFHRGLSDGLRGVGRDVPGDRSTDATDVYLLLVMWWRFVVRFASVSQFHIFVVRCLGPLRAGDKKRTEKICQRIGLRFRGRGRPRKIQTLALAG